MMKIILCEDDKILGKKVAGHIAALLNQTIEKKGCARALFSTGASQFTTFEALLAMDIDWEKVEFFHLDEYIGISQDHPASFIKYLKERFINKLKINLKKINFVDTTIGVENIIRKLNEETGRDSIDVGVIGIGENAHIAFNDPPADFDCEDAFKIVTLDDACRNQQLGEGWFKTFDDVPKEAVSMTPKQILKCRHIISAVPYKVKAKAIHDTLTAEKVTNMIPATILKTHPDWTLYIDNDSASLINTGENEGRYPHAPDVLEREYAENGFAKGWAMHAKPVPEYYFDSHVHYSGGKEKKDMIENICIPEHLRVKRMLVIFQIYGKKWNNGMKTENIMDGFSYFAAEEIKILSDLFANSEKLFWSAYLNYHSSETELVHIAADMGARCIKLHNAPQIEDNAPFDLWCSDEWQEVFAAISERKLPVLWHVTQRLPSSAYTDGKRNVYWEKGWKNGVTYKNEDLLQVFLTCCRRYAGINFIGAHQLHIGWERLDELFTAYHNLYVDTTIGCMLRVYDDFYPHDKDYLRSVFIKWADRILFGTDSFGQYSESNYLQHMRFISALDLPQDVLDKICHGNLERLCNMPQL